MVRWKENRHDKIATSVCKLARETVGISEGFVITDRQAHMHEVILTQMNKKKMKKKTYTYHSSDAQACMMWGNAALMTCHLEECCKAAERLGESP